MLQSAPELSDIRLVEGFRIFINKAILDTQSIWEYEKMKLLLFPGRRMSVKLVPLLCLLTVSLWLLPGNYLRGNSTDIYSYFCWIEDTDFFGS